MFLLELAGVGVRREADVDLLTLCVEEERRRGDPAAAERSCGLRVGVEDAREARWHLAQELLGCASFVGRIKPDERDTILKL